MKRTTLLGSVAAGLMAAAVASPAWAQATTYPEGTDCSAIQNSSSRLECINQMDESRQNPTSGSVDGIAPGDAPSTSNVPGGVESPINNQQPAVPQGGTDAPGNPDGNDKF